jgi:hypothetical protein
MAIDLHPPAEFPENYSGKLFLRLHTAAAVMDLQVVNRLNELSIAIKHQFPATGWTCWQFDDLSNALKSVILAQEHQMPFELWGEDDIFFMSQEFDPA